MGALMKRWNCYKSIWGNKKGLTAMSPHKKIYVGISIIWKVSE
ncbi:hypothetical protein II3_00149 [Bacillus cereus MC67]|uniref:Uncharacterized protein n=1 Tax=Bacillus cereus MC67 TaxID=1053219 RepID=J8FUT0_BACCE|nr:hypothetical protein II3_00149 [Bacillus cereus MC67]